MTNALYTRLEATAKRLIAAYGKSGKIVRTTKSGPAHAPVTTTAEHDAILVETDYKLVLIPQTLIQVGDKYGLISTASAVVPRMDDRIKIDGAVYSLVDLKPLNPGGLVLLHEFLARK